MSIVDACKFIGIDISIDAAKRSWDLTLGPLKLKNMPYLWQAHFTSDSVMIGKILSDCFIKRKVMWEDLSGEQPAPCRESLLLLATDLGSAVAALPKAQGSTNTLFIQTLRYWEARSTLAAKEIDGAIRDEVEARDAWRRFEITDSDEIVTAKDRLDSILIAYRIDALRAVDLLIASLPQDDPLKAEAESKRFDANDVLVSRYHVPSRQLQDPNWKRIMQPTTS